MDHEWSDALLHPNAVGWDWFGLRLDDGGAVMAFRIRGTHGSELFRTATLVDAEGGYRAIDASEINLEPLGTPWRSDRSGGRYPLRWRLQVAHLELLVSAEFPGQEMAATPWTPNYWEGLVRVSGDRSGEGYMELTGYAGSPFAP